MRGFVLAGCLLIFQFALPARADTAAGLVEFRQGQFAEAYASWREAADAGDPRGAVFVGVLYDTGIGVPQDYAQALSWYRRAAEGGSTIGAFNVGIMYDAGRGIAQDPQEAARWYGRAAEQGFGRAEYNLAMLYESGTGVARNRARAIQLYTRAASHGISAARAHLAQLGQPFAGDARPTEDPAMRDFQQAQQSLLSRGPLEAEQAAALFRQAAEKNNALAAYDLAYCYEHGMGVQRDVALAYGWYRRAARSATDGSLRSMALGGAATLKGQLTDAQQNQAEPSP